LDVLTDCLSEYLVFISVHRASNLNIVITIPVLLLWKVRISLRRKLALTGIFSLTIIVMIFAIVRVAIVTTDNSNADISWLYMWSSIEMSVCTSLSSPHESGLPRN
jgi:hypothetical protein